MHFLQKSIQFLQISIFRFYLLSLMKHFHCKEEYQHTHCKNSCKQEQQSRESFTNRLVELGIVCHTADYEEIIPDLRRRVHTDLLYPREIFLRPPVRIVHRYSLFSFFLIFDHLLQAGKIKLRVPLLSACDYIDSPLFIIRMHEDPSI